MTKKLLVTVILLFCFFTFSASAGDVTKDEVLREFNAVGAERLLKETELPAIVYELLPDFDPHKLSVELLNSREIASPMSLLKCIADFFFAELTSGKEGIAQILLISFLSGLLGVLTKTFGQAGIGEVAFMPCYLLISGIGLSLFHGIAGFVRDCLAFAVEFMNASLPVYSSLVIMMDKGATGLLNPAITTCVFLMANFVRSIIFPAIFLSATVSVAEHFSAAVPLHRLNQFFKKSIRWILCFVATIFAALLTISQVATRTLSGIGGRAGKYVIGNLVPVVGGFLTETLDTLFTCAGVIQGVVGIVGVVIIAILFISVLLRVLARIWLLQIASAISEAISDTRISAFLADLSETMSLLLAALACVMVSFIIYLSMLIRVGSGG